MNKINRWIQILYPLLVYYVIYTVSNTVLGWFLSGTIGGAGVLMISAVITLIPVAFIYRRSIVVSVPIPHDRKSILQLVFLSVLTAVIAVIFNIIAVHLPLDRISPGFDDSSAVLSDGTLIVRILALSVVVPLLEEILFRGIILGQLMIFMNDVLAVIISSILFGILHFNVVQFLYAFVMGLLLGYIYRKYRNPIAAWIAHGLCNLAVIILGVLYG